MIYIASRFQAGPTKRREIAHAQGISEAYLENILSVLKAQGLVSSHRGSGGGFSLPRPPSSVSLLEIVTALEGSISPVACVERPHECDKQCGCGAHKAWQMLHNAQVAALSQISLQDLVDMQSQHRPVDFVI